MPPDALNSFDNESMPDLTEIWKSFLQPPGSFRGQAWNTNSNFSSSSGGDEAWGSVGIQDLSTFDIFDDKWISNNMGEGSNLSGRNQFTRQEKKPREGGFGANGGQNRDFRGAGRVGNDDFRGKRPEPTYEEEHKEPAVIPKEESSILLKGPMDLQNFEDMMK